jgi:hypothetical protein
LCPVCGKQGEDMMIWIWTYMKIHEHIWKCLEVATVHNHRYRDVMFLLWVFAIPGKLWSRFWQIHQQVPSGKLT